MYRPLDIDRQELIDDYDFPQCPPKYDSYSTKFNLWHQMCFLPNPEERFVSADFVEHVLPHLESHIQVLQNMDASREAFRKARKLRDGLHLSEDEEDKEAEVKSDGASDCETPNPFEGEEPRQEDLQFSL